MDFGHYFHEKGYFMETTTEIHALAFKEGIDP